MISLMATEEGAGTGEVVALAGAYPYLSCTRSTWYSTGRVVYLRLQYEQESLVYTVLVLYMVQYFTITKYITVYIHLHILVQVLSLQSKKV